MAEHAGSARGLGRCHRICAPDFLESRPMIRRAALIIIALAFTGCAHRGPPVEDPYAASLRQSVANREMSPAEAQRRMMEFNLARQNAANNAQAAWSARQISNEAAMRALDPPPMIPMQPMQPLRW